MPVPLGSTMPSEMDQPIQLPFPARTKQAAGFVNGVLTDVMTVSFSDKILVTITQNGRLAQWVGPPNRSRMAFTY